MPAHHYSVFYGPDALAAANQHRQSTEGSLLYIEKYLLNHWVSSTFMFVVVHVPFCNSHIFGIEDDVWCHRDIDTHWGMTSERPRPRPCAVFSVIMNNW